MQKFTSFLLAVALTVSLLAYLFYNVGMISWLRQASPYQWTSLLLLTACSGAFISFGYRFIIKVRPWDKGHTTRSIVLLLVLGGTLTLFSYIMERLMEDWMDKSGENLELLNGSLAVKGGIISLILSLLIIWIDYSWFAFARYSSETIHKMRENRNKKELQFKLLRSQLTPHFLFNSLNTASHLVSKQPEQAEEFIRKLAFNFTNLLRNGIQPLNTLEREMEIIDNYMHLMKVRYGEKVILEKRIKQGVSANFLPALGIQLLVENALKHNVASLECPVRIIITADDEQVVVANTLTQKPSNSDSMGIGLQNLRERYLHYGSAVPTIDHSKDFYGVRLPYVSQNTTGQ